MCNCPLTSPNKVLISVFSRSLWLEWSFNYWRTALEGRVPMGTRSNSELLLRVLSAWEPCHHFDFNYSNSDALKSVLDLENYVQIDKLWTNKMSVSSKCFRTFSNLLWSKKVFFCCFFCFTVSHRAVSKALRLFSLGQVFFPSFSHIAFTLCSLCTKVAGKTKSYRLATFFTGLNCETHNIAGMSTPFHSLLSNYPKCLFVTRIFPHLTYVL